MKLPVYKYTKSTEPTKPPSHRTNQVTKPPNQSTAREYTQYKFSSTHQNSDSALTRPLASTVTTQQRPAARRGAPPQSASARSHRGETQKQRCKRQHKNKVSHRRIYTHITVAQAQKSGTSSVQQMPSGNNRLTSHIRLKTLGSWRCKNEI